MVCYQTLIGFFRRAVFTVVLGAMLSPLAAMAQQPVKLTLWFTDSRAQYKTWLDKAAAEYRKTHPNVTIDIVQMSPSDAYVKWPAAVASGNTPDITWMFYAFAAWVNDLPGGTLTSMDDIVNALDKNKFHAASLDAWRYKDKYLGVPYTRQPYYLFWRKDRFAAAGLKEPKTWDDIMNAAKVLHKPEKGEYGIAIAGKGDWALRQNFEVVLYSNGGHLLSKEGKPVFDNEVGRKAIDIYTELFKYTPPGSLNAAYAEVNRSFAQGGPAMAISLPVALSQFHDANPSKAGQVGALIPSNANLQITMQNNKGWSIFDKSPNKAEAKKFVQFLYTTEQYAAGLEATALGGLPLYDNKEAIDVYFNRVGSIKAYPDVVNTLLANQTGYYAGIDWYGQNPKGGIVGSKGILERNLNIHLARKTGSAETAKNIQRELAEIFGD
ncbi:MAG TPA: sugar ABC transporter substrate-binding protein [Noviherbaspirillum sp.]|uniref:ABC transporter substrate-binding protein n=1 Tax=Noviherbaspirillum sp. TaxID=1926288 RepID=UPI002B46A880|nr:sugar ABC transporter substrate-binding protein [Noviherbaspirillum sp.]HJV84693.1 sugar ABC transporter substrate-binding protein [Noviherbaspirillum sp.]